MPKLTKEERKERATLRQREREERWKCFPGAIACIREDRDSWLQLHIEQGEPRPNIAIRLRGEIGKLLRDEPGFPGVLRAGKIISPDECLSLIAALVSRYNHSVRESNAIAEKLALEPIAEITLRRDK